MCLQYDPTVWSLIPNLIVLQYREQAGFLMERLALRWMANVRDLELKDTAITPDMLSVIKSDADKIDIISSRMGTSLLILMILYHC